RAAVLLGDLAVGVREEGERGPERFLELLQRLHVVGRDGEDLRALLLDARIPVPVRRQLLGSTGGERLPEEREDDRPGLQHVVPRDGLAVGVDQREVGRLLRGRGHGGGSGGGRRRSGRLLASAAGGERGGKEEMFHAATVTCQRVMSTANVP